MRVQSATEAVRYAGEAVPRILRKELRAGPAAGLRAVLALWRGVVLDSDVRAKRGARPLDLVAGQDGCGNPQASAAASAGGRPPIAVLSGSRSTK
ncbi:hypothetical protein [Streptomyces sp. NPDC050263]|uniref:hypothetical protein n=1 Tax=Streptomyces sp. NPDC050263 TaxID=3155037 RepID=UPI00342EFED9